MKRSKPLPRAWRGVQALALGLLLGGASQAWAQTTDSDGDGIPDVVDNCVKVANPSQRDDDGDGYGNACDADLNNDGKVDDTDLALIKRYIGTATPVADLNEDGKVDDADYTIVSKAQGTRPGPTGLTLKPAFAKTPPLANSVQVFVLSEPLKDGRNAIVLADFAGAFEARQLKAPASIALHTENGVLTLNDIGFESDEKAGDGVFTGLIKFNSAAASKDISAFLSRARLAKSEKVSVFNGREIVAQSAFDLANPLEVPTVDQREFLINSPVLGRFAVITKPFPFPRFPLPATTQPSKTLMVTDLGVVQDGARTFSPCTPTGAIAPTGNPNGPWAFKTLMTNMANPGLTGISPQVFVNEWLKKWLSTDSNVKHSDGVTVPFNIGARPALQTIIQGLQPGWNPANPATLDLDKLPFRLLAIVNRLDLASGGYLGSGEPGELRFVFGLMEKQGASCVASNEMTVIFEYKVPGTGCSTLKGLANQWIALNSMSPGTAAYNGALQNLTDQVTLPNAFPGRVNNSAIGQVRTNEIRLAFPWEIREFTLQGGAASGMLLHETVKNTPDKSWNNTALMASYMNQSPLPTAMPRQFLGNDFLGAAIQYGPGSVPNNPAWNGNPQVPNPARFDVSLNTCSGCHLSETGTSFTMVKANGALNAPATLSRFLTGTATTAPFTPVNDAAYGAPSRHFNDLERRGQQLDALAANSCIRFPAMPLIQVPKLLERPLRAPIFAPGFVH